jgi:hypothetical protein
MDQSTSGDPSRIPPPSSNRTCGFPASGSHTNPPGSANRGPRLAWSVPSPPPSRTVPQRIPPSVRPSWDMAQSGFSTSCDDLFVFRPLRSTVVTRFPATMGLSDSRPRPAPVMDSRRGFGVPSVGVGSPRFLDLSFPARCPQPPRKAQPVPSVSFPVDDGLRLSLADWPLSTCVSRPNRVRLRYGSRVRLTRLRLMELLPCTLARLLVERTIYKVNSFQFTGKTRLGLAHQRTQRI